MNKKLVGIFLSYSLIVIDIVIGILLVPFLLKTLGDYEYGVYKLLISTASYLSVLDFGIGGTITRYVVKYNTENKQREKENFVAMGLVIYGVLSVAVLCIAAVVCLFIPNMYQASINPGDMRYAQTIFMVLCSTTAVQLFNHAFHGLFAAYEKFIYSKTLSIVKVCLRILLIFIGLYFIKSAFIVAIVDFVLAVCVLICHILFSKSALKFRIKLHKWEWSVAKEAGIFTLAILMQAIINQFNSNVDNVVLGMFTTAATIAVYSMALQLFTMYSNLSTAVSTIFLPSISRNVFAGASNDEITESIVRPSRMQLMVLLFALSGFILFGKDFINIWVGKGYETVYVLACILLSAATIELSQNTITSVLKAKNKLHGKTMILMLSTICNAIITVLSVPKFGVYGALAGTVFSLIFGYGLALNIYYHKKIGINMYTYYKKTYKGILPAVLISTVPGILIGKLINANSWIMFGVEAIIYCAIYAVIIYFIGASREEKRYILKIIKRKSNS